MASNYVKAVLFDLDGTLIDTAADFVRIIEQIANKNSLKVPPDDAIREQVSAGASAMVTLLLTHNDYPITEDVVQEYRKQFLDAYEAEICIDSQVYPEIAPFLSHLETHGTPWGIVTNKPRYLANKLLDILNLGDRCAVLVCPDDVSNTKPDPEPMYLALEKLGLPRGVANSVIYVGDHIRDVQAGNAAGMMTVLASYGYIPPADRDDLAGWQANYIVDTPKALVKLLNSKEFDYL